MSESMFEERKLTLPLWICEICGVNPTRDKNGKFLEHIHTEEISEVRKFETGATRDTDVNKLDYEGFLSPIVIKRYAEYMNKHRVQSNGTIRDSDNWQKGIPKEVYMKSLWRHFMDVWMEHRGYENREGMEDALCGILFNSMGYLHEVLKENNYVKK